MSEAVQVRVYEWRSQALIAGAINALINGALGFFTLAAGATLPLWGLPSLVFDLLAMSFGISFGTGLVVTPVVRAEQRRGRLRAPEVTPAFRERFAQWPAGTLQRSINLGVLSVLVFAPPGLFALWLGCPEGLERDAYTLWKAGFGFAQGAFVTPIIAIAALSTEAKGPA